MLLIINDIHILHRTFGKSILLEKETPEPRLCSPWNTCTPSDSHLTTAYFKNTHGILGTHWSELITTIIQREYPPQHHSWNCFSGICCLARKTSCTIGQCISQLLKVPILMIQRAKMTLWIALWTRLPYWNFSKTIPMPHKLRLRYISANLPEPSNEWHHPW